MDEREALDTIEALARVIDPVAWQNTITMRMAAARKIAVRLLDAGYGLRTQAWEQGRDAAADCMDDAEAPWAAKRIRALTPPDQMQRDPAPASPRRQHEWKLLGELMPHIGDAFRNTYSCTTCGIIRSDGNAEANCPGAVRVSPRD